MKLQIDGERVRIRVGRTEFAQLRQGATLAVDRAWPGQRWRLEVAAGPRLLLTPQPDCMLLALPAEDLDGLGARLPSREGLTYLIALAEDTLELRFEVDLLDGRARTR